MNGIESIAAERARQIEQEGWTPEHDDQHTSGEIGLAAAYYAAPVEITCEFDKPTSGNSAGEDHVFHFTEWRVAWPWDESWRKPKSRREDLVRAGALIAAEIDRLDRLESKSN